MRDPNSIIHNLKTVHMFEKAMQKLTIEPKTLEDDEIVYLLTSAVVLLRKYQSDRRCSSYVELAYYIVLRYSLIFEDYRPLYDVAVAMGFYPICQAISDNGLIQFEDIPSSLIYERIAEEFSRNGIVETYDQRKTRDEIIERKDADICFVAPTSFGKSELILDHIEENWDRTKKVAIIVPTKSLLMQTYRGIRKRKLPAKVILHDEMYNGQECFIAVLTQERALRLLDKKLHSFDVLYIDEAHRMFEREQRSILLTRLIRLNRARNNECQVLYFSPLIENSDNLLLSEYDKILLRRIPFNMKEAELFEYKSSGDVYKYNRFIDEFLRVRKENSMFEYIIRNATEKTFCYLYAPRKIEEFSVDLSNKLTVVTEIADAMGIARGTAYKYLVEMDARDMLQYDDGEIITPAMSKISIEREEVAALGKIACGEPALEEESLLYRTSLPTAVFGKGPFYILYAKGDSMVDADIEEGDILVIRKNAIPNEGDIIVALDENQENTLKRYAGIDPKTHMAVLKYQNKAVYGDKVILVKELVCQGVLSHVIKEK